MVDESENLSEEDKELIRAIQSSAPQQEEKFGVFQFFSNVLKLGDTTKVSNLKDIELQMVRVLKNVFVYSNAMGLEKVKDYVNEKSEVLTASALSRDGFLIRNVVTARRDINISEGGKKKGKSKWFAKNVEKEGGEE